MGYHARRTTADLRDLHEKTLHSESPRFSPPRFLGKARKEAGVKTCRVSANLYGQYKDSWANNGPSIGHISMIE